MLAVDHFCAACCRWHADKCSHNPDAACRQCGVPQGWKGADDQPDCTCFWCWSGTPRPAFRPPLTNAQRAEIKEFDAFLEDCECRAEW